MQSGGEFTEKHQWIINYVGEGLAEDLNNRKPDIVIVDASNGIANYPYPVNMINFFSKVSSFKDAWRNYRYEKTINQCDAAQDLSLQVDCKFAIYRRNRS